MELYALSLSVDSYYGYTNPRLEMAGNEVTMRADIYISERNPLPKPGKRCRNVFMCQPPIKSLRIFTRCCSPSWPFRTTSVPIDTLHVETGIRIGDMLDAYARTAEAHKLCPDAIPDLHDDEGFVIPRISFEANVATLEDDPKLLARRRLDNKRKADNERRTLKEQKLGPYISAKQTGKFPSLVEEAKLESGEVLYLSEAKAQRRDADKFPSERQWRTHTYVGRV